MILSASRRTDIPCYYPQWMMNRLREGYALTRNPLNPTQLSRVQLTRDVIDCIVFWTKDPAPMLPYLDELDQMGYPYYFQFTLTPYGHDLERNLRPKDEIMETFIALSKRLGRSRIIWRYDPIILNDQLTVAYHKEAFEHMCRRLAPYTDTVTISFVDLYAKIKRAPLRPITREEIEDLSIYIAQTASSHGLQATACCEAIDLSRYGIKRASCIDAARIEQIINCPLDVRKDKNQRAGCGCCESIDIGAYNSCKNDCVYCYANTSLERAEAHFRAHRPNQPLLIGSVGPNEAIRERTIRSNKLAQTSLFDDSVSR